MYTDDVVVMIKMSSITKEDCLARRGTWDAVPQGSYIPGTDLVGTVYSMGKEAVQCSGLEVGDRVYASVPCGANAKYITLPYDRLMPVPRGTGSMAAIGLLSSYVPAQQCLEMAKAKTRLPLTGKNVLIIGSDPVALAVLDLSLNEGAIVFVSGEWRENDDSMLLYSFVTIRRVRLIANVSLHLSHLVANERHHNYLSRKGANCLPVLPSEWLPEHAGTMDVVVDSVCLDNYESTSRALSPGGVLVCSGQSAVWSHGIFDEFRSSAVQTTLLKLWAKYVPKPKKRTVVYYDREESRKDVVRTDVSYFALGNLSRMSPVAK